MFYRKGRLSMSTWFKRILAYVLVFSCVFSTVTVNSTPVQAAEIAGVNVVSQGTNYIDDNQAGGILSPSEPIIRVGISNSDASLYNNGTVGAKVKAIEEWGHRVPRNANNTMYFVDDVTYDAYYNRTPNSSFADGIKSGDGCPVTVAWYDPSSMTLKESVTTGHRIKRMVPNSKQSFDGTKYTDKKGLFGSPDIDWYMNEHEQMESTGITIGEGYVEWEPFATRTHKSGNFSVKHLILRELAWGADPKKGGDYTLTEKEIQNSYTSTGTTSYKGLTYTCKNFSDLAVMRDGKYEWQNFLEKTFKAANPDYSDKTGKELLEAMYVQAINNISYFFENVDYAGNPNHIDVENDFTLTYSKFVGEGSEDNIIAQYKGSRAIERMFGYISPGVMLSGPESLFNLDIGQVDELTIDRIKAGYVDLLINFWIVAETSGMDAGDMSIANDWEIAINKVLTGDYDDNNPPAILIDICTDVVTNFNRQGRPTSTFTDFEHLNGSAITILSVYDYLQWAGGTTSLHNLYSETNANEVHKLHNNTYDTDYPDSTTTGELPYGSALAGTGGMNPAGLLKYCIEQSFTINPKAYRGGSVGSDGESNTSPLKHGASIAAYKYQRLQVGKDSAGNYNSLYTIYDKNNMSYIDLLRQNYGIRTTGELLTVDPTVFGRDLNGYPDNPLDSTKDKPRAEYGVVGFTSFSFDYRVPSFSYEFQIDSPVREVRTYDEVPEVILDKGDARGAANKIRHTPGLNGVEGQNYSPMANMVPYEIKNGFRQFSIDKARELAFGEDVYKKVNEDGSYEWVNEKGEPAEPKDEGFELTKDDGMVVMTISAKGTGTLSSSTTVPDSDVSGATRNLRGYVDTWKSLFETSYGADDKAWDRYNMYIFFGRPSESAGFNSALFDSTYGMLFGSWKFEHDFPNITWSKKEPVIPYSTNTGLTGMTALSRRKKPASGSLPGLLSYSKPIDSKVSNIVNYEEGVPERRKDAKNPVNYHISPAALVIKHYDGNSANFPYGENMVYGPYKLLQTGVQSSTHFYTYYQNHDFMTDVDIEKPIIPNFPKLAFWKDFAKKRTLDSKWNVNDWGELDSENNYVTMYINPSGKQSDVGKSESWYETNPDVGSIDCVIVDNFIDDWNYNYLNYTPFDITGTDRNKSSGSVESKDDPTLYWYRDLKEVKGGVVKPSEWLTFLEGNSTFMFADYSPLGTKLYNGEMLSKEYYLDMCVYYKKDPADPNCSWSLVQGNVSDWDKLNPHDRHCTGDCSTAMAVGGKGAWYCKCNEEGKESDGSYIVDSNWLYKYLYDGWDMVDWHFPYIAPKLYKEPDGERIQIPEEKLDELLYSSIPENYAEIKEGEPGNERYEAMAGVPTTETLYFTSGGSEFKVDLAFEYEPNQTSVWRTYINQYTNSGTPYVASADKKERFKREDLSHTHVQASTGIDCEYNKENADIWPGIKNGIISKGNKNQSALPMPTGNSSKDFELTHNENSADNRTVSVTWTGTIPFVGTSSSNGTCGAKTCSSCGGEGHTHSYCSSTKYKWSNLWNWSAYDTAVENANAWITSMLDKNTTALRFTSASDNVTREYIFVADDISVKIEGAKSLTSLPESSSLGSSSSTKPANAENATQGSHSKHSGEKGTDGSFTITVTFTLPNDHMLCGPCCGHRLPPIQDSWMQNLKFDTMRITKMDVYQMTEGKVNGVGELSVPDNNNVYSEIIQGKPTIFYNIAEENARNRLRDGISEGENGNENAKRFLKSFDTSIDYTNPQKIFNESLNIFIKDHVWEKQFSDTKKKNALTYDGWLALPYNGFKLPTDKENRGLLALPYDGFNATTVVLPESGTQKLSGTGYDTRPLIYKDRLRHEAANSSLDGRLRYSFETSQDDHVFLDKGQRTNTCNGAWHTSCVDSDGDTKVGNVCPSINDPNAPSREVRVGTSNAMKPAGVLILNYNPVDVAGADSSFSTQANGIYMTGHLTLRNVDATGPDDYNKIILPALPDGVKGLMQNPSDWQSKIWGKGIIYNNPITNGWREDANALELDAKTFKEDTADAKYEKLNIDYQPYGGDGDYVLEDNEFWHRPFKNATAINNGLVEYSGTSVSTKAYDYESVALGDERIRNTDRHGKSVIDLGITSTSKGNTDDLLRLLTTDVEYNDDHCRAVVFYADEIDKLTPEWEYINETRTRDNSVTVISDFLVLQTTSGDQVPLYFEKSNLDVANSSVSAQGIYPYIEAKKSDIWDDNPNSASKWEPNEINIGSYNGDYEESGSRLYTGLGNTELPGKFDGTGGNEEFETIFDTSEDYTLSKWLTYDEEIPQLTKRLDALREKFSTGSNKVDNNYANGVKRVFSFTDDKGTELWKTVRKIKNERILYPRPQRGTSENSGALLLWKTDIEMRETNPNKEYNFGESTVFYELIESYRGLDRTAGGYVTGYELTDALKARGLKADYVKGGKEYAIFDEHGKEYGKYLEDCRWYAPFLSENDYMEKSITLSDNNRGILFNQFSYDDIARWDIFPYSYSREWFPDSRLINTAANRGVLKTPYNSKDYSEYVNKNFNTGFVGEHKGQTRLRVGFTNTATYSPKHTSINPVVTYNPVSVDHVYIESLPGYRDQRTNSTVKGGASELLDKLNSLKVCPRTPGKCEFRVLNCKVHDDEVLFDVDFSTVKSNKVSSKVKSFTNSEELNEYWDSLSAISKDALTKDEANNSIYRTFTIPSGINLASGKLNLSNNKLKIPYSELGATGITDLSGLSLEIEMTFDFNNSKPSFLVGTDGYGYYVGNTTNKSKSNYLCGSWVTVDNLTPELTDNMGYISDLSPLNSTGISTVKLLMNMTNLKANKVYKKSTSTYFDEISQTQLTKGAGVSQFIGDKDDALYIGGWGYDNTHNGNMKLKSLKIVKKGITEGCTEACYGVTTIHAKNKVHIHDASCEEISQDSSIPICGLSEGTSYKTITPVVYTYDATNSIKSLTLKPGVYKLEAWGAAGVGTRPNTVPGKGGYSSGTFVVNKDTTVYIGVGSAGTAISDHDCVGGYNGGGSGHHGAGGGASHIALKTGLLQNLNAYRDKILLVAGGGGGSSRGSGGDGGGANQDGLSGGQGYSKSAIGSGGTLTAGGTNKFSNVATTYNGTKDYSGSFGLGGSGTRNSSAGGGGYYGGGASYEDHSADDNDDSGGGGGSGYANTSLLTSITGEVGVNGSDGMVKITKTKEIVTHTHTEDCFPALGKRVLVCTEEETAGLPTTTKTFTKGNNASSANTLQLPKGTTVTFELWGAQGGGTYGGKGGYSKGTLKTTADTVFNIFVGGQDGTNGGGAGDNPGGGASDIRMNGTSLTNRIIVAGGGGGGASAKTTGGIGGGANLSGENGIKPTSEYYGTPGEGGTLSRGGKGGLNYKEVQSCATDGTLGLGGSGLCKLNYKRNDESGGGGGYYGGGGAGHDCPKYNDPDDSGAGGGSGYADKSLLTDIVGTSGVREGDGSVKITYSKPAHKHSVANGCYVDEDLGGYKCDVTTPGKTSEYNSHIHTDACTTNTVYSCDNLPLNSNKVYTCGLDRDKDNVTYDVNGSNEQVFTAPYDGWYKIDAYGGKGGKVTTSDGKVYEGGNGGHTKGDVYLTKDEKLYIHVGGAATIQTGTGYTYPCGTIPGINGGGFAKGFNGTVAAGGGMTYISKVKTSVTTSSGTVTDKPIYTIELKHQPTDCTYQGQTHTFQSTSTSIVKCGICGHSCGISNGKATYKIIGVEMGNAFSSSNLIMVAAGGGGASYLGTGGPGGGSTGYTGVAGTSGTIAKGGNQSEAGLNAAKAVGGSATSNGAGGGAGYYGGGAGTDFGSGAGGSSYIMNNTSKVRNSRFIGNESGTESGDGRVIISWDLPTGHAHNSSCSYQYSLHEHTNSCAQSTYYTCGAIEKNKHSCIDEFTRMERTYTVKKSIGRKLLRTLNFENSIENIGVLNGTISQGSGYAHIKPKNTTDGIYVDFKGLNLNASQVGSMELVLSIPSSKVNFYTHLRESGFLELGGPYTKSQDFSKGFVTVTLPLDIVGKGYDGTFNKIDFSYHVEDGVMQPLYLREVKFYSKDNLNAPSYKAAQYDFKGSITGFAKTVISNPADGKSIYTPVKIEGDYIEITPTLNGMGIYKDFALSEIKPFNRIEIIAKANSPMEMNVVTDGKSHKEGIQAEKTFTKYIIKDDNMATNSSGVPNKLKITFKPAKLGEGSIDIQSIKLQYEGTDANETTLNRYLNEHYLKGTGDAGVKDNYTLGVLNHVYSLNYDLTKSTHPFKAYNVAGVKLFENAQNSTFWHVDRDNGEAGIEADISVDSSLVDYIDLTLAINSTTAKYMKDAKAFAKIYYKTSAMSDYDNTHVLEAPLQYIDYTKQKVRFDTSLSKHWSGNITGLRVIPAIDLADTPTVSRKYCTYLYDLTLGGTSGGDINKTYSYGPGDKYVAGTYEVVIKGNNLTNAKLRATGGESKDYALASISSSDTELKYIMAVTSDTDNLQIVSKPIDLEHYEISDITIKGININEPLLWCSTCKAYTKVKAIGNILYDSNGHSLYNFGESIMFVAPIKGTGNTYRGASGETCWTTKRVMIFGTEGKRAVLGVASNTGNKSYSVLVSGRDVSSVFVYDYIPDDICMENYISICEEPHHEGKHYDTSNKLCWDACMNDDNHKIKDPRPADTLEDSNGSFINLDYTFRIVFPNVGDFAGDTEMGIGKTSRINGPGYEDNMDFTRWLREKRVKFSYNVIYLGPETAKGKVDKVTWQYIPADTWFTLPICSDDPSVGNTYGSVDCDNHTCFETHNGYTENCSGSRDGKHKIDCGCEVYNKYRFYCTLNNDEAKAAEVTFEVEAINCGTQGSTGYEVDDVYGEIINSNQGFIKGSTANDNTTQISNYHRNANMDTPHGARSRNFIDIVGRIGNLMSTDTEDYRFSNLFKVEVGSGDMMEWVIRGVVPKVALEHQKRYYGSVAEDIRGYEVSNDTNWLNTYGMHEWMSNSLVVDKDGRYKEGSDFKFGSANFVGKSSVVPHDDSLSKFIEKPMQYPIVPITNASSSEIVDYSSRIDNFSEETEERKVTVNYSDKLNNQYLRLGYSIFSSLETIGNYWDPDITAVQVIPYYYAIDLNDANSPLVPLDVYIKTGGVYKPINIWGNVDSNGECKFKDYYPFTYQINWKDEFKRRKYSDNEANITNYIASKYKKIYVTNSSSTSGMNFTQTDLDKSKVEKRFSIPEGHEKLIGTAQSLYLGKIDNLTSGGESRTFVGSPLTYPKIVCDENGDNAKFSNHYVSYSYYIKDYLSGYMGGDYYTMSDWAKRAQRWHYSLGLPSSAVFVPHNTASDSKSTWTEADLTPVTTENMDRVSGDSMVILMAVDIIAQGNLYVLQWQRPYMRDANDRVIKDTNGFKKLQESNIALSITKEDGTVIERKLDLNDYGFTKQPIVVYASNKSSEADVAIEKTH